MTAMASALVTGGMFIEMGGDRVEAGTVRCPHSGRWGKALEGGRAQDEEGMEKWGWGGPGLSLHPCSASPESPRDPGSLP